MMVTTLLTLKCQMISGTKPMTVWLLKFKKEKHLNKKPIYFSISRLATYSCKHNWHIQKIFLFFQILASYNYLLAIIYVLYTLVHINACYGFIFYELFFTTLCMTNRKPKLIFQSKHKLIQRSLPTCRPYIHLGNKLPYTANFFLHGFHDCSHSTANVFPLIV